MGIWEGASTLITNVVAVIALMSGVWVTVGRPLKKRYDEDRRERLEKEQAEATLRAEREAYVDERLDNVQSGIEEIKESQTQLAHSQSLTVDQYNVMITSIEKTNDRIDKAEGRLDHFEGVMEGLSAGMAAIVTLATALKQGDQK